MTVARLRREMSTMERAQWVGYYRYQALRRDQQEAALELHQRADKRRRRG